MRPLIIDENGRRLITDLCARAAAAPVAMDELTKLMETPGGAEKHMARMTAQTIELPVGFVVTYSVETGHPAGTVRHLSVSVDADDRLPSRHAVVMIAEEFGFAGGFTDWFIWREQFANRGVAINVAQPLYLN